MQNIDQTIALKCTEMLHIQKKSSTILGNLWRGAKEAEASGKLLLQPATTCYNYNASLSKDQPLTILVAYQHQQFHGEKIGLMPSSKSSLMIPRQLDSSLSNGYHSDEDSCYVPPLLDT